VLAAVADVGRKGCYRPIHRRFAEDRTTIAGHCESLDDVSGWPPWVDITLTKQPTPAATHDAERVRVATLADERRRHRPAQQEAPRHGHHSVSVAQAPCAVIVAAPAVARVADRIPAARPDHAASEALERVGRSR
jgi:hypothetical protein